MQQQTKHILVTGGLGFIGSHVCDTLCAQGYNVIVLDDCSTGKREQLAQGATLVEGDVANARLVQTLVLKADAVIHLAAIASVAACESNRSHAHKTNAGGTQNVMRAAATSPKKPRVIYASSAAIYGNATTLPISESTMPAPLSIYGQDKYFGEKEAAATYQKHGLNSVGLRFFNVYGERQDPASPYSGVISLFAKAAIAREAVTVFGDGKQTRDFIYVSDIVQLILAALESADGAHVLNGCTGKALTLLELITQLNSITDSALSVTHAPAREQDIRHSLGCPALAKSTLGFASNTPLKDGLTKLVHWMQHG